MLLTSLALLFLQVGPAPSTGSISAVPEELRNRPPRPGTPAVIEAAPDPAALTPRSPSSWLEMCLDHADTDPARAFTLAQIHRDQNEGPERVLANHCLGLAASGLERWDDARAAFLAGRAEVPAEQSRFRARLGTMAGNAALAGGDINGALALFAQARTDVSSADSPALAAAVAIDQARALVALERLEEALPLLVQARELRPADGESRLLSATLLRRLGKLDEAQAQIESAAILTLDPQVGVEAGVIAMLGGREDAARKSWQSVVDTRPASSAAAAAEAYLEQLDTIQQDPS